MKKWISPNTEKYLGLGLQLAGSVLLGFFVGFYLDRKFETLPGWTLGGIAAGLIVGFTSLVMNLRDVKDNEDQ